MAHGEVGCDHIDNLPDNVLSYILGFLPILEAVRTCILSHRWLPLWKFVPNLNFKIDSPGRGSRSTKITVKLNRVLSSHYGNANSCLIEYVESDRNSRHLIRLIQELFKRKNIQKLVLKIRELRINFPPGLFSYKTLQILELNDCVIKDASCFNGNLNLNLLSLTNVELTDKVFCAIISNCASLEKLNMRNLYYKEKLLIISDNLKFLNLEKLMVNGLEVQSESLNVMVLDNIYYGGSITLCTPNLHHFYLGEHESLMWYYYVIKNAEILERCSGSYKRATTLKFNSPYENLLTMSIALDLNDVKQAHVLSLILRLCVKLQTLYIKKNEDPISKSSHHYIPPYPEFTYWERQEQYDCVSFHLRRLELTGFKGNVLELAFLKYILANGHVMDMLVIHCDENCSSSAIQLLSLPKASIHLSVVIKPTRGYTTMEGGNLICG